MRFHRVIVPAVLVGVIAGGFAARAASARSNVGAPVHAAASTGHTITVSGHGEVSVAPDRATVTLGVETHGQTAQDAFSANAQEMAAVIAAVQAQGIPANKIQTSNVSLYYDSEKTLYVATHDATVIIDTISKTGPVLDAAVAAGADHSWGVQFGLKDQSGPAALALQEAVTDARPRANAIATGLGVSVSGVGSASDVSASSPIVYSPVQRAGVAAPSAPTPIQAGDLTVTENVNVVYTFG